MTLRGCDFGGPGGEPKPTDRLEWVERLGQHLKNKFGIKEARQGFMVGQKSLRWSDQGQATPSGN